MTSKGGGFQLWGTRVAAVTLPWGVVWPRLYRVEAAGSSGQDGAVGLEGRLLGAQGESWPVSPRENLSVAWVPPSLAHSTWCGTVALAPSLPRVPSFSLCPLPLCVWETSREVWSRGKRAVLRVAGRA